MSLKDLWNTLSSNEVFLIAEQDIIFVFDVSSGIMPFAKGTSDGLPERFVDLPLIRV